MAKLEDWVSNPENHLKLMEDLKKKLDLSEMEKLENYLKDKKLKKNLCFTANEINKIRSNRELKLFLENSEKAKFPLSMLDFFFDKDRDYMTSVSEFLLDENEESMQTGSSGYGSFNLPDCSQMNDQSQLAANFHSIKSPRVSDVSCNEKKTSDSESRYTRLDHVLPAEKLGSPTLIAAQNKSENNMFDGDQKEFYSILLPSEVEEPMQVEEQQDLQYKERSVSDVINPPDVAECQQDQKENSGSFVPAKPDETHNGLEDLHFKKKSSPDLLFHGDVFDGDENECCTIPLPVEVDVQMHNEGLQGIRLKERSASNVPDIPDVPNDAKCQSDHNSTSLHAVTDDPMQKDGLQDLQLGGISASDQCKQKSVDGIVDSQENINKSHMQFNKEIDTSGLSSVKLLQPDVSFKANDNKTSFMPNFQNTSVLGDTVAEENMDIRENDCKTNEMLIHSTPLSTAKKRNNNRKKVQNKTKTDQNNVFRSWALKQCSNSGRNIEEIFHCILIRDVVEHSKYSFLKAEKVMMYENSGVKQIIHLNEEKKLSLHTKTRLHYHMYICGIQTTIVLGPQEKEMSIDMSFNINEYVTCISKVFLPALALYKNIQRKKKIFSLI